MRRIALVGAGKIAEVHAEAVRRLPGARLAAVVDPVIGRAEALARRFGDDAAGGSGTTIRVHDGIAALLDARDCDAAHVLVPPPLHRAVAEPLLRAGLPVLLEKPMAGSEADCAALQQAARDGGAALQVNQNFVHHPAYRALRTVVDRGAIGRVRHASCHFNMPLRQMAARQFGHWMFDSPVNLLLEQAVHPLSQLDDLLGPVQEVAAIARPPRRFAEGVAIVDTWLVSLLCARGTAQLQLALGQSYPAWGLTVIGDDGAVLADMVNNRVGRVEAGPWMDFWDSYRGGVRLARSLAADSRRNAADYLLSTIRLKPRSDPFFRSILGSVTTFYDTLDRDPVALDGALGRRLVALCERIAAAAPAPAARPPAPAAVRGNRFDVLVLGGTGFIGTHVVAGLLREGRTVAVMARNLRNLPALFHDARVGLVAGDAGDPAGVRAAIDGAPMVINLAHGGGGADWPAIERALVGSARTVAETCLEARVERLIHLSSIAALYLGDPAAVITGATPPDPHPERRADYARAKILAERLLLELHRGRGLPVVILRPGVVVGEGGAPFHSGIGTYNRERHCLGWNDGTNPLPLVLAEDVADAILRAMAAPGIAGRCYNLVGDVRLSAREYTAELARALGRPLCYHPQSLLRQQAVELCKWGVKRAIGRRDAALPSLADLRSRGMTAQFDITDVRHDLGWTPVADRAEFIRRGIAIHARD